MLIKRRFAEQEGDDAYNIEFMVDDILLTPEEQGEKAKKWLKDNGLMILLGVALGLGAIFGYQTWQTNKKADAEAASSLYNTALSAVESSDLADISTQLEALKSEYSDSPYAVKASLLKAKQLAVSDLNAAYEELLWAEKHASELGLQQAAKLRQAKVLIALGELEKSKSLAQANLGLGYDSNYQEILGDIAVKQEEFEIARDYYQQSLASLSSRLQRYEAILRLKLNRLPISVSDESESDAAQAETASSQVSATESTE